MKRRGILLVLFFIVTTTPIPIDAPSYDFDVPILSWKWLYYSNLDSGEGIYGSFTVETGKDVYFFVVDQENYDEILVWGILADFTTAKDWGDCSGTVDFTFITPYADSWYFCWSNYDGLVTVNVEGDMSIDMNGPTITILSPAGSQASGTITISASAVDDHFNVEEMRIYIDDVLKSSNSGSSITYSWDTTTVSDGSHTIKYYASDNVGNSRISTRYISIDNSPAIGSTPTTNNPTTQTPLSVNIANAILVIGLLALCGVIAGGLIWTRKKEETPQLTPPKPTQRICQYCGFPNAISAKKCENCQASLWKK